MGIRYIQTINKQPLPIIREPIPSFQSQPINLKTIQAIIFKRIENNCKKESHTGKWSDINKSQKQDSKTNQYYEVTQKHSNTDSKYAYVLYPGLSKDDFNTKR